MTFKNFYQFSSKNAVVINLDQVQLEEIVEEKLLLFFNAIILWAARIFLRVFMSACRTGSYRVQFGKMQRQSV